MDALVIDVSKHNGRVDFEKVKAAGIYGVIIRAGYGRVISQKDIRFEENYAAAKAAGLKVGAYWYSYAATPADAQTEAKVFCEAIKDKQFELPVYYDIEEKSHVQAGIMTCSAMTDAFCGYMEKKGYFAGVYSFDSFFGTNLYDAVKQKYTCWVARVENVRPKTCAKYDMWQYTFKMALEGIKGAVDCSHLYKDFESIIKRIGLNGFKAADEKFSLTARRSGLDKSCADELADMCQKNGMTTVIEKEG